MTDWRVDEWTAADRGLPAADEAPGARRRLMLLFESSSRSRS